MAQAWFETWFKEVRLTPHREAHITFRHPTIMTEDIFFAFEPDQPQRRYVLQKESGLTDRYPIVQMVIRGIGGRLLFYVGSMRSNGVLYTLTCREVNGPRETRHARERTDI